MGNFQCRKIAIIVVCMGVLAKIQFCKKNFCDATHSHDDCDALVFINAVMYYIDIDLVKNF